MYYAAIVENTMVHCFFLVQDTKLLSRMIMFQRILNL